MKCDVSKVIVESKGNVNALVRSVFVLRDTDGEEAVTAWLLHLRKHFVPATVVNVLEHVVRAGLEPSETQAKVMLASCVNTERSDARSLRRAWQLFRGLNAVPGPGILGMLAAKLARRGDFATIRDIQAFAEDKGDLHIPGIDEALGTALIRRGYIRDGTRVLNNVRKAQTPLHLDAQYTLMVTAARRGMPKKVERLLAQVRDSGAPVETRALTALMAAYARTLDVPAVKRVMNSIVVAGSTLTTVHWNILLDAHVRRGEITAAREVLDGLTQPSAVSYSIMMRGLIEAGEMLGAQMLVERWRKTGQGAMSCDPYHTLASGYLKLGDAPAMARVFVAMARDGVRPSAFTHLMLAQMFALQRDAEGVLGSLGRLSYAQKPPTQRSLMACVVPFLPDDVQGAKRVLRAMVDYKIPAGAAVFAPAIADSDAETAMELMRLLERSGAPVNNVLADAVQQSFLTAAFSSYQGTRALGASGGAASGKPPDAAATERHWASLEESLRSADGVRPFVIRGLVRATQLEPQESLRRLKQISLRLRRERGLPEEGSAE